MCEIDILDRPDKYDEIELHNKVTGNRIKKEFLAKFNDYQTIARIAVSDGNDRRPFHFAAVVDVDDLEQELASENEFIKVQMIQTFIRQQRRPCFSDDQRRFILDEARWIDGMFDYNSGQILKYRLVTEFLKKEDIKIITIDKDDE